MQMMCLLLCKGVIMLRINNDDNENDDPVAIC